MDEAADVVERLVIDRQARMIGVDEALEQMRGSCAVSSSATISARGTMTSSTRMSANSMMLSIIDLASSPNSRRDPGRSMRLDDVLQAFAQADVAACRDSAA